MWPFQRQWRRKVFSYDSDKYYVYSKSIQALKGKKTLDIIGSWSLLNCRDVRKVLLQPGLLSLVIVSAKGRKGTPPADSSVQTGRWGDFLQVWQVTAAAAAYPKSGYFSTHLACSDPPEPPPAKWNGLKNLPQLGGWDSWCKMSFLDVSPGKVFLTTLTCNRSHRRVARHQESSSEQNVSTLTPRIKFPVVCPLNRRKRASTHTDDSGLCEWETPWEEWQGFYF